MVWALTLRFLEIMGLRGLRAPAVKAVRAHGLTATCFGAVLEGFTLNPEP